MLHKVTIHTIFIKDRINFSVTLCIALGNVQLRHLNVGVFMRGKWRSLSQVRDDKLMETFSSATKANTFTAEASVIMTKAVYKLFVERHFLAFFPATTRYV